MSPIWVMVIICVMKSGKSALIQKKNKLETIKDDLKNIETNVNDFTFDLLQGFFGSNEDDYVEVTTQKEVKNRTRRSADDDLTTLCKKYCKSPDNSDLESQQIQQLKREVRKLKQIVELMKDQDDVFNNFKNVDTKIEENDKSEKPNHEELSSIRTELNSAIKSLNQTRGLLDNERLKSAGLDRELKKQKQEMIKLEGLVKRVVAQNFKFGENIVTSPSNNDTMFDNNSSMVQSSRASSELSEIRKLLSDLEKTEDSSISSPIKDSTEVLESKIVQLEEKLQKRKKQQSLSRELKALEQQMEQDENENQQVIKQITKLINKNQQPQSKGDDFGLDDLQEAINKLRPKETIDENQQFQLMINKLINNNNNPQQQNFRPNVANFKPQPTSLPLPLPSNHQQPQSPSKSYVSNNGAYICFVNDASSAAPPFYSNNQQGNNYYQPPPPPPYLPPEVVDQKRVQFFQAPAPQNSGNFYAQPAPAQPSPQQTHNYQQNGDFSYQEDLRKQIDGLQVAINSLNRPEYAQNPEDKAMVQNLEYQIGDLRNIVATLNQNNYGGNIANTNAPSNYRSNPRSSSTNTTEEKRTKITRQKRSFEDNQLEDEDMGALINKMSKVVFKAIDKVDDNKKAEEFDEIQNKIDSIKNQLSGSTPNNASNPRSVVDDIFGTSSYQTTSYSPSYSSYQPISFKEKKTAVKLDFFTELVAKIMDKIVAAIPVVLRKLFNFSLESLFSGGDVSNDGYNNGYGKGENDLSKVFKNLGVFGLIPALLLRIVNGMSAFHKILRKNKFFSRFLIPVVVLGVVAGSVLFLIWWLQPDDMMDHHYQSYQQNLNNYGSGGGYADSYDYNTNDNNYQGYQQTLPEPVLPTTNYQTPNYPVYSRSYYNSRTPNNNVIKLNK